VPKRHYQVSTYRAQNSIGYLMKRADSMMLDVLEPLLEKHGFTFVQYLVLSWLRDGIALNPKDICFQFRHNSGTLTRVIDQLAERGADVQDFLRSLIKLNTTLQLAVEPGRMTASESALT
jgi:DNA-binding MarR family transcriptional regulator